MFFKQGKKFALCTNCGKVHGQFKSKYCSKCKQNTVHNFDSNGEAFRYLHLKDRKDILDLRIQVKYPLYAPELICSEGWSAKYPEPQKPDKPKNMIVAGHYTADFVYFDTNNPKGWTIEDYKPYNPKIQKPIIKADTQLRLNWLHAQVRKYFDIIVSYEVPKKGYQVKTIKPNKKS